MKTSGFMSLTGPRFGIDLCSSCPLCVLEMTLSLASGMVTPGGGNEKLPPEGGAVTPPD